MASAGVVTAYARAWEAADHATLIGLYAEDVVVHYGGTSPFSGTHQGRDRFVDVLLQTAARGKRSLASIDQVHDDGDTGAIFVTERFEVDGEPVEVQRALRYRTAGGRITECWLYDQDQHLVDRAWSEPAPAI